MLWEHTIEPKRMALMNRLGMWSSLPTARVGVQHEPHTNKLASNNRANSATGQIRPLSEELCGRTQSEWMRRFVSES